jgi:hypothetical protein
VQATSLPATEKQYVHAQREAQSKLLEINMIRRYMHGNKIAPFLLINSSVLNDDPLEQVGHVANLMLDRLKRLAASNKLVLIEARSQEQAADFVNALV